ncbi:PRA1 protein B3 [Stylosanthes scabra]|uniref:PRA1 family protein n=1 Tax=Stylosanthes scabra TaxID=79078 RepID=A0ABU6UC03_9FABA|nr:PRA1 protein B3 [Stylosanthes scabra]
MAESPPLPISTPHAQTTSSAPPPISTSAFRSFISHLSSSLRQGFSDRRPWSELLDRSSISRPESFSESYSRIRKNASYFRVNYVTLIALALALSLLTHPFSLLILLSLLAAWSILYLFRPSDQPLLLFGRTFSDRETLPCLVVLTVIVVFLTSVGAFLISALIVGLAVVCLHGAFRVPEDLFLDEPPAEPRNAGLLSFLSGGVPGSPL